MKRKFHTPEQIVKKLREADAAIASGSTIEQVCRQLEIRALQKENARLKKLVADQALDNAILKEALSGNY